MLSASGIVSVFAGTVGTGNGNRGDDGVSTSAIFDKTPCSLWMDASSNMFINDYGNDVIRKVSSAKIISLYAGMCTHPSVHFIFLPISFRMPRVFILILSYTLLSHTGSYSTTDYGSNGDSAISVALKSPFGIGGDSSGNLYIAETATSSSSHIGVRVVQQLSGDIVLFAGTGIKGHTGDLGLATSATLEGPTALCVDTSNNVYFADAGDQSSPTFGVVRKVYNSPNTSPTSIPQSSPTSQPSRQPTEQPSRPTNQPSNQPSVQPTSQPSKQPSNCPSDQPTSQPSKQPSSSPTKPTGQPSNQPSIQPSSLPSMQPSNQPSSSPTNPTGQPSNQPSQQPSRQPSSRPSKPSNQPSSQVTITTILHPLNHMNLSYPLIFVHITNQLIHPCDHNSPPIPRDNHRINPVHIRPPNLPKMYVQAFRL